MIKSLLNFFVLLLVCRTLSLAQVPNSFNFQGVARDASSQPLASAAVKIRASLIQGTAADPALYVETHDATTNKLGLFTIGIGTGTASSGTFASIVWEANTTFLKIEIDPDGNGFNLVGTTQLLSVPYALYANKAGNAGSTYTANAPLSISASNAIGLNTGTSPGDLLSWDGTNWVARQPAVQKFTLSNMQPSLVLNYCIALEGVFPTRNGEDPFVAEIMLFAGNFEPVGYAFCNGQLLAISQNTALFSLIGTIYGGDGKTTFALPDLRGRVPMGSGQGTGLQNYAEGTVLGTETISR